MLVHAQLSLVERQRPKDGPQLLMCAECCRCGHVAEVPAGAKLSEAQMKALTALADSCPKESGRHTYADRVIPAGVRLWYPHPADGKAYELAVTGRKVHLPALGALLQSAPIWVIPESKEHEKAAQEFGGKLHKWGYQSVTVKPAGYRHPVPQEAKT
jgi:hypothetical protein